MKLRITKKISFDAAHMLLSSKDSPECERLHGHTWGVEVTWETDTQNLSDEGMSVNFRLLKLILQEMVKPFDHGFVNDVLERTPTAENLAEYFYTKARQMTMDQRLGARVYSVRVYETQSGWVEVVNELQ